jgi:hypothetical protein
MIIASPEAICRPGQPGLVADSHVKRTAGPMPAPPGKSAVTVREAVPARSPAHAVPARGICLVRLDKPVTLPPADSAPVRQLQRENQHLTQLYVDAMTRLKESFVRFCSFGVHVHAVNCCGALAVAAEFSIRETWWAAAGRSENDDG